MSKPSKRWQRVEAATTPEPINPKVEFPSLQTLEALAKTLCDGGPALQDLDRADMVALDGMIASNRRKRISLAKQAIEISPLSSDAYLTLGLETTDPEHALPFYQHAYDVGRLVVHGTGIEDDTGDFWGLLETRPSMRAQQMLALTLWNLGRQDEAIRHYQEMIQRNPDDNQGIRYPLLDGFLIVGRDEDASELLRSYPDEWSANWTWGTALMEFRTGGDGDSARLALSAAHTSNAHVKGYLVGEKRLPSTPPDFVGMGDPNEAQSYVHGAMPAWSATEGAIDWVRIAFENGLPEFKMPSMFGEPACFVDYEPVTIPEDIEGRIDAAALALLHLGAHDLFRTWKGFDFDVLDRLFEKGMISDPKTEAKSVTFTADGLEKAELLYERLFVQGHLGEIDPLDANVSETTEPE